MPNKFKAIVIEDEPSLSGAIKKKLSGADVHAEVTKSGREAIDMIKRNQQYSGIWLDFDILDFDGLEFMKQFTKLPKDLQCPVLIVSNTGDPGHIKQAIALGAKKWIVKAEARLDDTVEEFIKIISG